MGSNSNRRSVSSEPSRNRKRVVIGPGDRTRDRYSSLEASVTGERKRTSPPAGRRPVPGSLTHAGRAVAGGKAEQRDLRQKAQRRSLRLRALAVLAVFAVAVFASISVYRSQAFAVKRTEVVGASRLSADQVRKLSGLSSRETLLRLPARRLERNLKRSAWVASAEVSRDFPDTVRIRIVERTPLALVDLGGKTLWLVDGSGIWLAKSSGDSTGTAVVVRDVEGLDPVAGRRTDSETLMNALEIARSLDASFAKSIHTISAPSIDKTALVTSDDVEVFVGSSDDIARKQQVAEKILKQQAGKVVYINVRTVDRPTWRGLDTKR
jgi:cell division protein FtsQ